MSDRVLVQGEGASIRVDGSGSTVRVVIRQNIATGGGGVTVHNDLAGRSVADAHPISAVSGLQAALDAAGGPVLSDAVPQPSGLADAGVAVVASRGDHVHAPPTAGQIGAVTSGEVDAAIAAAHLDGSQITTGTVPDAHIPSSIARDSEVSSAISTHAAATDPHGDRAYADGLVDDLSGVTNAAAARSNLGLGALATLSAVSSAEIVDGTIVNADVGAGAAIALSKLAVDPLARANHTGTQAQSTVTNLVSDLAGKAATVHTHSGADLTSGTVGSARLGTGTADSSTFLRGDQTWATPSGIADPGGSNDDFLQRKSGAWTNRTVAQVKADLGVQHVLSAPVGLWTGPVSGNTVESSQIDLYLSAIGRGSASLVRLAAGTYDRVAVSVQSVGAATIRLGLWAADPTTGMPGDLVLDAGTISVAGSAGLREITINQTLSGWYWCSVSCDAYTSAFTMWGIGDTASSPIFGMPVATSDIRLKSRNALPSGSFGSGGLPSTFPTQGAPQPSGPKLIFRRSA